MRGRSALLPSSWRMGRCQDLCTPSATPSEGAAKMSIVTMTPSEQIAAHLRVLAGEIGARPSGSPANRRATDYVHSVLRSAGVPVREQHFTCKDWEPGPGFLELAGPLLPITPNPFSPPCDVPGPMKWAERQADLEALAEPGSVLVISGELTMQPYFPKAFPFMTIPEQQAVITMLEALEPAAVIAVTERGWPPIFDDGDIAFSSTTVNTTVAAHLARASEVAVHLGGTVHLGTGVNISAGSGSEEPRIVLSAHIDTKATTPGAFDNAGSVAVLLALAQEGLPAGVELVFFNGEDHYAAPGEQAWLASTDIGLVRMAVNLDGTGVAGRRSTVTGLACPDAISVRLAQMAGARPGWTLAEPWFESDHAIFAIQGIPSLALTCEGAHDLLTSVAHTAADTLDGVDPHVLADVATFVREWLDVVGTEGLLEPR